MLYESKKNCAHNFHTVNVLVEIERKSEMRERTKRSEGNRHGELWIGIIN